MLSLSMSTKLIYYVHIGTIINVLPATVTIMLTITVDAKEFKKNVNSGKLVETALNAHMDGQLMEKVSVLLIDIETHYLIYYHTFIYYLFDLSI